MKVSVAGKTNFLIGDVWVLLIAAGTGLLLGTITKPTFAQSDQFRFLVERTAEGVALKCEKECAWKTLSWTCSEAGACKWGVNSMGLFSPSSESSGEGFQIVIEAANDGGVLTCKRGCAWKELTWTCEGDPCEAKVDFNGLTTRP